MRVRAILAAICLFPTVVGCAGIQAGGARLNIAPGANHHRASEATYLYVPLPGKIERYPIINGVLASSPTSYLDVPTSQGEGLAVGSDGTLYVALMAQPKRHKIQGIVNVYAPAASGHDAPIRQILTKPARVATATLDITVDSQGYLFWEFFWPNEVIQAYAPGAQGYAKPVSTIHDFRRVHPPASS
jgi:hypothetical protein